MRISTVTSLILTLGMIGCGGVNYPNRRLSPCRETRIPLAQALLRVYAEGSALYGAGLNMCVSVDNEADLTKVLRNLEGRAGRTWESRRCVTRGLALWKQSRDGKRSPPWLPALR
jgi:hypothetical protein